MGKWQTIEKPGYFGKKRDAIHTLYDRFYGKGDWRIMYQWGNLVIPKEEGIQLYEDGYYEFLKANPDTLEWLITTASDIYDTAPTNVEAGFNYTQQETPNNHIQDVSIRRTVLRLGTWFKGDHLMHVRGPGTEGEKLSPYLVPFHMPEMILQEDIKDYGKKGKWWRELGIKFSVEEFYQHNKILQVRI
ncbi:hypothetical protein KY332_04890 [Candidatus Woesearchaeota archaeon]|nr:hypothetical protein [Candidatus Woesearchaeota archaeon]